MYIYIHHWMILSIRNMRGCNDVYTVITCIMNMSSLCSDPSYTCTCIHIGVCTCAVYSVCSFVCTCTNVLLHVGTLCCTFSYWFFCHVGCDSFLSRYTGAADLLRSN